MAEKTNTKTIGEKKQRIKAYSRAYYIKNKESLDKKSRDRATLLRVKVKCVCSATIGKSSMHGHLVSAKHKHLMEKKQPLAQPTADEVAAVAVVTAVVVAPQSSHQAPASDQATATTLLGGKVVCACGARMCNTGVQRHLNTAKHKRFVAGTAIVVAAPPVRKQATVATLLGTKVACACGAAIGKKTSMNRHLASAKHKHFVEQNQPLVRPTDAAANDATVAAANDDDDEAIAEQFNYNWRPYAVNSAVTQTAY